MSVKMDPNDFMGLLMAIDAPFYTYTPLRPSGKSRIAAGVAKGQMSPPGTSPFDFDASGQLRTPRPVPVTPVFINDDDPVFMEFDNVSLLPGGGLITPPPEVAAPEPEPPKEGYGDW